MREKDEQEEVFIVHVFIFVYVYLCNILQSYISIEGGCDFSFIPLIHFMHSNVLDNFL